MKNAKNWFWGVFLLLAAVVVVAWAVTGFAQLGFWTILAGVVLAAAFISSLVHLNLGGAVVALALLYVVFQKPLNLFYISPWVLILAAVLAGIGLSMLIRRRPKQKYVYKDGQGHWVNGHLVKGYWADDGTWVHEHWQCSDGAAAQAEMDELVDELDAVAAEIDEVEAEIEGVEAEFGGAPAEASHESGGAAHAGHGPSSQAMEVESGGDDNHPYARVSFGAASHYLHGSAVEAGQFEANFGALEVYFDQAVLHPNGADIHVEANFGAVRLFVPATWELEPSVATMLGAIEIEERRVRPAPGQPKLRISGNVSLGALEVKFV